MKLKDVFVLKKAVDDGTKRYNQQGFKGDNMTGTDNVFKEALTLRPFEKAQMIDKLLSVLDKPDEEIDELWAREAME